MATCDKGICRGCGRDILWIKNENGKPEPFDARTVRVLHVEGDKCPGGSIFGVGDAVSPVAGRDCELDSAHLPHFVSCPKADQFRRARS